MPTIKCNCNSIHDCKNKIKYDKLDLKIKQIYALLESEVVISRQRIQKNELKLNELKLKEQELRELLN